MNFHQTHAKKDTYFIYSFTKEKRYIEEKLMLSNKLSNKLSNMLLIMFLIMFLIMLAVKTGTVNHWIKSPFKKDTMLRLTVSAVTGLYKVHGLFYHL
jgi:hypothetical protein